MRHNVGEAEEALRAALIRCVQRFFVLKIYDVLFYVLVKGWGGGKGRKGNRREGDTSMKRRRKKWKEESCKELDTAEALVQQRHSSCEPGDILNSFYHKDDENSHRSTVQPLSRDTRERKTISF